MHQLLQPQHVPFQENPSLHRQPNTPEGLKQDQSCHKSLFTIRIFRNFEGEKKIHFIPFHTIGTPNTQEISFYRLLFTAVLFWFSFMFTLVSVLVRNLFYTHLTAMQEFSRCPLSPTPLRDLEVQAAEGHCQCSPHKGGQQPSSLASCRTVLKTQSSPCEMLHVLLGTVQVRQTRIKHAIPCHHISSDLPPRALLVPWHYNLPMSASTRTQKLNGNYQDILPLGSVICFQLLFYLYSQNAKCMHRAEQHKLTSDKQ